MSVASGASATVPGLVFVDAIGRVVFADQNFLTLTRQPDVAHLVGEPLHKVLGVPQPVARDLIKAIGAAGYVHEQPLSIADGAGNPIELSCTGVAAYDDRGNPIGADLTLHEAQAASPHALPTTHQDALSRRIQQIEQEVTAREAQGRQVLTQLYFTAQASALQVLLGRLGGPHVREMVETMLNKAAAESHWDVRLRGGHFVLGLKDVPDEAYRALLETMVAYGTNIAGRRIIETEMQMVDGQMTPHAQEVAAEIGLRDFLNAAS